MSKRKPEKTRQQTFRRPLAEIKDWQAVLIITGLALFFFRDILFQKAFFWEDFIYQYYPFRNLAAVALSHGELPLWNPYTFNGQPFQSDIQSAIFYLPNLLLTLFVSGGKLHFYWVELFIVLHFVLAGVTMYFLARSFQIPRLSAIFSGIVYAFSGFMVSHTIHQAILCHAAWLPLIVLLFRRAVGQKSILWMCIAGLVLGHAVLAGSPQISLYIFFFLLLIFFADFFATVREHKLQVALPTIPIATGVIVIAVALTAAQLLPTLELAPLSQRAEMTFEKSSEGSLGWDQLVTFVIPKFFGVSDASGSTFWASYPYWQYWETAIYIGLAALVGIIGAMQLIKKDRFVRFLFGVMIFAILYSFGDHFFLHKVFYTAVPGFKSFRIPARMSLLLVMSGALLAGFGITELTRLIESNRKYLQRVAWSVFGAGIILFVLAESGMLQPSDHARDYPAIHSLVTSQAMTALVFLLAIGGLLFLAARQSITPTVFVIGLLTVQFIDMYTFGSSQNNGDLSPQEYYARYTDEVKFLNDQGQKEYFRVNSRQGGSMALDRNQGMIDRVFMMEGYTPLALQRLYPPASSWERVCDLMNAKYRIAVDEKTNTMQLQEATTYLPRSFMVYSARVIMKETEVKSLMERPDFDPSRIAVFEDDPQFPLSDTTYTREWTSTISSYSLNQLSIDVSTPKNGFLVLSEMYYPGWHAYIDGVRRPLYRTDWNLRAVPVESGKHRVEVRYEPESFARGAMISSATLILSFLGIIVSLIMKRRRTAQQHANNTIILQ
jgi:hypothetical protein